MSIRTPGLAAVVLTVALISVPVAQAAPVTPVTLIDNASTVQVDVGSQLGMYTWDVSGTDQLQQQWFWYRIGSTGPESSVDTLAAPFYGTTDTNFDGDQDTLFVRYIGAQIQVELTFTLTGTDFGTPSSDIAETIKLKNLTGHPLELHFFEYCNLDLGANQEDQSVQIVGGNTAQQQDIGYYASETVETPNATYRRVDFAPTILNLLNDALPTVLMNDNLGPIGPGDLTWAFQWDVTLGAAGSGTEVLLISKDKQLVPEPATMMLLTAGGALLMLRRRRRR